MYFQLAEASDTQVNHGPRDDGNYQIERLKQEMMEHVEELRLNYDTKMDTLRHEHTNQMVTMQQQLDGVVAQDEARKKEINQFKYNLMESDNQIQEVKSQIIQSDSQMQEFTTKIIESDHQMQEVKSHILESDNRIHQNEIIYEERFSDMAANMESSRVTKG